MSKLLERTFRLVKRESFRDWDVIQGPLGSWGDPLCLCRQTMKEFFAIPAGVNTIIVSLWEHETPHRVAVNIDSDGDGSIFIGEGCICLCHPALEAWLKPFVGRTLYAQVNYEE